MRRVIDTYRALNARFGAAGRRLPGDERGVSFIITALAATMLIGFVGLAIDVGMWQVQQRNLQGAADQAALAAVVAYRATGQTDNVGTDSTAQSAAYAAAVKNGYPVFSGCSSPPCVTVASYSTPIASTLCAATANTCCSGGSCVAVTITQQQKRYFSGIFLASAVNASAQAIATCNGCTATSINYTSSPLTATPCAMALDPAGNGVLTASGTPVMSLDACDLYNNSSNTSATVLNGGAVVQGCSATNTCGSNAYLAQPDSVSGNFDLPQHLNAGSAPDPYAGATAPTVGTCQPWLTTSSPYYVKTVSNVDFYSNVPGGTYCPGNINNQNVTFASGAVVVMSGGFTMKGNSNLGCTGCMLYVTGGATSINANSTINFSAPTGGCATCTPPIAATAGYPAYTGEPSGIAVWFAGSSSVTWNGNNSTGFSGAIYAPSTTITFSGTSTVFPTQGSTCSRVIAGAITLGGTATVNLGSSGCPTINAGFGPVAAGGTTTVGGVGQPVLVQ